MLCDIDKKKERTKRIMNNAKITKKQLVLLNWGIYTIRSMKQQHFPTGVKIPTIRFVSFCLYSSSKNTINNSLFFVSVFLYACLLLIICSTSFVHTVILPAILLGGLCPYRPHPKGFSILRF